MTAVELLRKYQGTNTRAQYAETLGVSVNLLNAVFAGERRATEGLLVRLARAIPEAQAPVSHLLFFDQGYHNSSEPITEIEAIIA